ncbi:unnamed protein product [Adineta steineri]|uniref:NAD(P)(+)--arginine ADP-ribosyltransferase n=1 Tax=Adineta steineri TaxID=433720 RepID=A0A819ZT82_9BILA|nr:unnamed protein product [Adineta steineri]CAF4178896.1 unnamed protein product [Adineta steineri]
MAVAKSKNTTSRFLDAGDEPNQALLPIRGYAKEPLLPLEEAVQPINELLDDLDMMVDTAKWNSKKPADGLTTNESAAIHLYTMQWEEPNVSLYTKLNSVLRSERREPLKPWFRYMKLILTALYKLPPVKGVVWRGVRGNLSDKYDDDHIWWGFSSCTESVDIMEQFVGKSGVRTLFNIECINGKAIRAHSFFKKENEILLLPGTYMRVVGKWSPSKDLYIIHLREIPAPRPYLEPPFTPTDTSTPAASTSAAASTATASPSTAASTTTPTPPTNKTTILCNPPVSQKHDLPILEEKDPPITSTEAMKQSSKP